jgi:hypothetical protein
MRLPWAGRRLYLPLRLGSGTRAFVEMV